MMYIRSVEDRFSAVKRAGGHTASGTEADDTGDELLESAFRSAATAGPRQRGERKRSQYRHRKSCKSNHESCFFLGCRFINKPSLHL
mgnify:CR=1 FL=1